MIIVCQSPVTYLLDVCYVRVVTDGQVGLGCSKLTTSFVNPSLKFQTLISQLRQYFLLKKCESFCKLLSFFQQKYHCIWL